MNSPVPGSTDYPNLNSMAAVIPNRHLASFRSIQMISLSRLLVIQTSNLIRLAAAVSN